MKFKKVVALASIVASMTVMSQSAFANDVYRCHDDYSGCIADKGNTGTGSVKAEYYERGTGRLTGIAKVYRD
ncbi:hypothetical protein [Paenibacillus popilliae]|uniref:Uncharacterized protein n=1 Tax=Paenibacillus popilliae ATCC 14706 TaxID=1212764 RepID=M9LRG2_PAEPP|nr:hypothetical protein [Paenibacillus popilliae]GAC43976.1 hypothetical protein PPOP_3376 [Paenibacillus popilliae ATCC 14706]